MNDLRFTFVLLKNTKHLKVFPISCQIHFMLMLFLVGEIREKKSYSSLALETLRLIYKTLSQVETKRTLLFVGYLLFKLSNIKLYELPGKISVYNSLLKKEEELEKHSSENEEVLRALFILEYKKSNYGYDSNSFSNFTHTGLEKVLNYDLPYMSKNVHSEIRNEKGLDLIMEELKIEDIEDIFENIDHIYQKLLYRIKDEKLQLHFSEIINVAKKYLV